MKVKIPGIAILIIIILFVVFKYVRSDSIPRGSLAMNQEIASDNIRYHPTAASNKKRVGERTQSSPAWHNNYPEKSADYYQVITENNLFRPLGWQKEVVAEIIPSPQVVSIPVVVAPPPRPPAPTYSTLTLTGIAQNGSEWVAIFEDSTGRGGGFLHRGEKLKDARVSEIFPGYVTLAQGETQTEVALGKSIQYDRNGQILFNTVGVSMSRIESRRVTLDEPKVEEGGGEPPNSLIERMKARRQKELGQ